MRFSLWHDTHMPTDSTALFMGLTGPERFAILKAKERALAVAKEEAYRTTIAHASEVKVPDAFVQWGKNLRRDQSNLIAQLIRYIDNGAERKLIVETRDGLNRMIRVLVEYADHRLPLSKPQLIVASDDPRPSGRVRVVHYDKTPDDTYMRPMGATPKAG